MKRLFFSFLVFLLFANMANASEISDNYEIGIVDTNSLNLRSSTDKSINPICKLSKNEKLKVFGKIDDWFIVETESNIIGIVSSEFIKLSDSDEVLSSDESKLLSLINKEREKNNLSPLVIDSELQNIARLKANDLVENNYFSHISPIYGSPFEMLKKNSIKYKVASENIAGNSDIEKAVNNWLDSPSHKKNILSNDYNYTGIGIASSIKYGKIIVELFIGR